MIWWNVISYQYWIEPICHKDIYKTFNMFKGIGISSTAASLKVHSHMRVAYAGGGGRKIGFNTNHYIHSHIRGRRAGAKSALQQMGPTPNFPPPLRNRVLQTISVPKKWQIRLRPLRTCVNIPAVVEREWQNPPVSAPQLLRAYVNVALLHSLPSWANYYAIAPFTCEAWLHFEDFVQDCSNSIAWAMELLQSYAKPATCVIDLGYH